MTWWIVTVHSFGGSTAEAVEPMYALLCTDEAQARAIESAFNSDPRVQQATDELSAWAHPLDGSVPVGTPVAQAQAIVDLMLADEDLAEMLS